MVNKKGVTIIELLIALAILVAALAVVYPFFNTSLKTLNVTQAKEELQNESQKAINSITDKLIESSRIIELRNEEGVDKLSSISTIKLQRIVLKSTETSKVVFEVRSGKLYCGIGDLGAGVDASKEVALCIESIEVSPVTEADSFNEAKGLMVKINAQKSGILESLKTQVKFRNYE